MLRSHCRQTVEGFRSGFRSHRRQTVGIQAILSHLTPMAQFSTAWQRRLRILLEQIPISLFGLQRKPGMIEPA